MDMTPARLQLLIDGGSARAATERAALRDGRWREVLEAQHPEPPWHKPGLRRERRRCIELAVAETSTAPETVDVELLPVWWGDNEDGEGPEVRWFRAHALRVGDGVWGALEIGPCHEDAEPSVDRRLRARAHRWTVASVVPVRSYAPSIPMIHRGKTLGAIAGELLEVMEVEVIAGEPLPSPELAVPPFCAWFEPRVAGVSEDERQALVAMSITVDDEGNLVERPAS